MTAESSTPLSFDGDEDSFNGVTLKPKHYGDISIQKFHERLTASLEVWQAKGKRGAWVQIPLSQAELVPVVAKLGFEFHHTQPDYIMMAKWLPTEEPSTLPAYATHYIGVAGFVVNDKNEVLLVQEKWLRNLQLCHWKLPGGHSEPGEEIWQTAIRETLEETGIKTEFVSLLCFRHMHGYRWGTDDLYFACLLHPMNTDITVSPSEIADAKWMDVDAYLADPNTSTTNRLITQAYKDGQARGLFIHPTIFPHFFKHKPDMVLYSPQPTGQAAAVGTRTSQQQKANI